MGFVGGVIVMLLAMFGATFWCGRLALLAMAWVCIIAVIIILVHQVSLVFQDLAEGFNADAGRRAARLGFFFLIALVSLIWRM